MIETWVPVVGYEGIYEVSDLGRVRALPRWRRGKGNSLNLYKMRILKPRIRRRYLTVKLYKDGKSQDKPIHILVAAAFVGPRPQGWQVDHINRHPLDNRETNIRYTTPVGNALNSAKTKLDMDKVVEIRQRCVAGERKKDIATTYGISRQMVRAIEVGRTWKAKT
jgi:hypothetical protein